MSDKKNTYLIVMLGERGHMSDDIDLFKSEIVQADAFEEVEQSIADKIRYEYGDFENWDSYGWREITFYLIESQHAVDIQKHIRDERAAFEQKKAKKQEEQERTEYERLKKKYGGQA